MKKNISLLPALLLIGIGFAQCKKDKTVVTGRCAMPADPGLCTAAITRYYLTRMNKNVNLLYGEAVGNIPLLPWRSVRNANNNYNVYYC